MLLQIIINSIINALLISLVALGFNLIFSTTKVFHLAHGAIYVFSAYSYWTVIKFLFAGNSTSPQGILTAIVITTLLIFLLVWVIEKLIYKPISDRTSNQTITLIASMGVYLFIVNALAMCFNNDNKSLSNEVLRSLNFGNIILTKIQLWQAFVAIVILIIVTLFYKYSDYGLKIIATKDNYKVSSSMGIDVSKIRLLSLLIGSMLAATAAILTGYDTGFDPNIGFGITLTAAVIVVLSGNLSIIGTLTASFIIIFIQNLTEYWLSTQWKEPITFLILLLVILWKTEGIVNFNIRIEEK